MLEAVEKLRFGHDKTANAFSMETFSHGVDQGIALRQTVKLAYLIDPASYRGYSNMSQFENDPNFPVEWKSEQTFKDFFNTVFPTTTNTQELWTLSTGKKSLKAWKLRQRLKIRIERTDDLAAHLVYNPARKSLMVFHQVEWLKAQIKLIDPENLDESVETSLSACVFPDSKSQLSCVDVPTLVAGCPRSSLLRPFSL